MKKKKNCGVKKFSEFPQVFCEGFFFPTNLFINILLFFFSSKKNILNIAQFPYFQKSKKKRALFITKNIYFH
jgi:hypothetical protein